MSGSFEFIIDEMKVERNEAIMNAKNFDEILDSEFGKIGTEARDVFEENARVFIITALND